MESFSKHTVVYLNALIATNFLMTCFDELEGTKIFRHELKRAAKRFRDELIKSHDEDINKIWGINDGVMYGLMDQQERLLKEIAVMRPETCEVINEMIKKYKLHPEAIENWLGVKIVENI